MWRLVVTGKASLSDIERFWSISQVMDANEALDVAEDVQQWMGQSQKAQKNEGGMNLLSARRPMGRRARRR